MTKTGFLKLLCAAAGIALPGAALAHTGHFEHDPFVAGLMHPLTGVDHLATGLLAGLWAAIAYRDRIWMVASSFVAALIAGFLIAGFTGIQPVEIVIIASMVVVAWGVAGAFKAPLLLAVPMLGLFAFAHGVAHGSELPVGLAIWETGAGLLLSTTAILTAGIVLGTKLSRPIARLAGIGGMATGGLMLLAT